MTTGLNNNTSFDCTIDTVFGIFCSSQEQDGAYRNAPYTLLRPVLENATGQSINIYNYQNFKSLYLEA